MKLAKEVLNAVIHVDFVLMDYANTDALLPKALFNAWKILHYKDQSYVDSNVHHHLTVKLGAQFVLTALANIFVL